MTSTEQYWATEEDVAGWRKRREELASRVSVIQALLEDKETIIGEPRKQLSLEFAELSQQLRVLKIQLKDANLLRHQEALTAYGLDPNDPRGLLAKAYHGLLRLRVQIKALGGQTEEGRELLQAIELYLSYNNRTPAGKLKWVAEQVES